MADLYDFPFLKKIFSPSTAVPQYNDDFVAMSEGIHAAMRAILGFNGVGLPNVGFWILDGMVLSGGVYTPGICWLNGVFYMMKTSITPGLCLEPDVTNSATITNGAFTNSLYTLNYMKTRPAPAILGLTSPVFTGSMDYYRLGLVSNKIYKAQLRESEDFSAFNGIPAFYHGYIGDTVTSTMGTDFATASTDNIFRKDQFGKIEIYGCISFTGTPGAVGATVMFVIEPDFLPDVPTGLLYFPIQVFSGIGAVEFAGFVQVPTGNVYMNGGTLANQDYYFKISYQRDN